MGMFDWYKKVLSEYANFQGRATRNEFWWFYLVNILIVFGLMFLAGILLALLFDSGGMASVAMIPYGLLVLYGLAIFIPTLAVIVRRLHDVGKSGWFYLISIIPLIGAIILIVFLAQPSEPNANKWGPVPGSEGSIGDGLVDF